MTPFSCSIHLCQHHVARSDVFASELGNVHMVCDQNQSLVAFAFELTADELLQIQIALRTLTHIVKK